MEISPRELLSRLNDAYLVDVRLPWEHDLVHLPDHALIPLHELPARLDEVRPPPGALVVAYCHHGMRSLTAATLLRRAGFAGAVSLEGGIDLWSRTIDPSLPRY